MSLGVTAQMRALAHPTRMRILSLLTGAAMTAAEVARELSLTHANASYHLRLLHRAGTIVVAGEEKIHGGLARRYRYIPGREGRWSDDPDQRRAVYSTMAGELVRRAREERGATAVAGTHLLADAEVWVPRDTWDQVRQQVNAAALALHQAAGPPRSPGTVRVSATIALFEMEPPA
jgi:DNA-binding transcriptional ArsR family regulator